MMTDPPWALLSHTDVKRWRDMREASKKRKNQASFNLWSFVSGQVHYENLHSDVIKELLAPQGIHDEQA